MFQINRPCRLRRRLEAEFAGRGTREFIKVLRLLEKHSVPALKHAVQHGLEIGATGADAIRLILEYQQEEPIALFCLDGRPQLKLVRVAQTDVSIYQSLLILQRQVATYRRCVNDK